MAGGEEENTLIESQNSSFSVNIKTTNFCLKIEMLKIKSITDEVFENNMAAVPPQSLFLF